MMVARFALLGAAAGIRACAGPLPDYVSDRGDRELAQISKNEPDVDKRREERRRPWEKSPQEISEEARKWQEENAHAIRSWNDWVEKNGLPLAEYRQF
jgi:hypothetical protein